jgi:hypothetical protein
MVTGEQHAPVDDVEPSSRHLACTRLSGLSLSNMEIVIITIGCVLLPIVTIIGLILLRNRIEANRKADQGQTEELISTLEEIVTKKSEQISELKNRVL